MRASRARIVAAGDAERRRLERDLHDGAQQRLLALGLALQLARAELAEQATAHDELLAEAEAELQEALVELRELARGIHPAILTDGGLGPALRHSPSARPYRSRVSAAEPSTAGRGDGVVLRRLRSARERRQARVRVASGASVGVRVDGDRAVVVVEDDGVGGADLSRARGSAACATGCSARRSPVDYSGAGNGHDVRAELPCA